MSEQSDEKTDALDVAASGTRGMRVLNGPILGGAAIAFGAPAAVAGAAATVFAALTVIVARTKQLWETDAR